MNFSINSFEAWGIVNKKGESFHIQSGEGQSIEVSNNEIKDLKQLLGLVEDALCEGGENGK